MMPAGGDGATSAAAGASVSVSAHRRAEKRQPSAKAATTVNSVFMEPISLRPVSLYRNPTGAAERTALPSCSADTGSPCLAPWYQQSAWRRTRAVDKPSTQASHKDLVGGGWVIRDSRRAHIYIVPGLRMAADRHREPLRRSASPCGCPRMSSCTHRYQYPAIVRSGELLQQAPPQRGIPALACD